MGHDFKDKYVLINSNMDIEIDLSRFKGTLQKAQSDLAYQIIADTMDYAPFKQGTLSNSVHLERNNTEIVYNTPYARFLYMGKLMLDDRGSPWAMKNTKKHVVNKDLEFSKETHRKAGSKWFERSKEDNFEKWVETVKKAVKE